MKSLFRFITFSFLFISISISLFGQNYTVNGRVTDKKSNTPLPFVNIFLKGSLRGVQTNMDGYYTITTNTKPDSIYTTFLGYKKLTLKVPEQISCVVNFALEEDIKSLNQFVVTSGENPALRIIRRARDNKSKYKRSNAEYIKYDSYTKIQIEVDNINPKIRKRKVFKKVVTFMDSLSVYNNMETPNVPVYFSENASKVISGKSNKREGEYFKGININFIGKSQADLAAQLSGSDLQEYDFFQDNVSFFQKEFLSPIGESALLFYNYKITDTTLIDSSRCFKIAVVPKNKMDLAFSGFIWIEDSLFALKRLDLTVEPTVNINFVDKISIQQELIRLRNNIYVSKQMNLNVDFANVTKRLASFIYRAYVYNKNFDTNVPTDTSVIRKEFAEDVLNKQESWWNSERMKVLTGEEILGNKIIDSISNFPFIKTSTTLLAFLGTGYITVGKFDLGTLQTFYARNAIEGDRYRFSLRTNRFFSRRLTLRSYLAYGATDNALKYNIQAEYILVRFPWLKIGIGKREDNDQLGTNYTFSRGPAVNNYQGSLYNIGTQINDIRKLNRNKEHRFWADAEVFKGFTGRIVFTHCISNPLFTLAETDSEIDANSNFSGSFINSEFRTEGRWTPGESFIQNGNDRISLGNRNKPNISFIFIRSVPGILGSTINYSKLYLNFRTRIKGGVLGYSNLSITGGKIFSSVPLIFLEVHRGNETPFFGPGVFNTMNFFEFVSDQFVNLNFEHHFSGFFFNRIPFLKKLKWRELVYFNTVYGNVSSRNNYVLENNNFSTLQTKPFAEGGIGIENILKVVRIDFIFRLNYIDADYRNYYALRNSTSPLTPFAIKFSMGIGL